MSLFLIILVVLVGLILVALEIVALPGGISGICGGILVAVGIWLTYSNYGMATGNIILLSSIVIGIALLAFFMKSRTWKRASLDDEIDSKANPLNENVVKPGARGVTISRLAPAGNAVIDNETVEVHTTSEFIDPNKPIEVIEVDGYRVLVKEVTE